MKNKKDNLRDFLAIKNQTSTSADLYFYKDIVSSWSDAWDSADQYPESIRNFLDDVKGKDLNIYINSGGGAVFAGFAIYNMLSRHQGFKTVYVDGLAASISSVIALAGDKIIIPENGCFMIHKPLSPIAGNALALRERADLLDKLEDCIMSVYMSNVKEGVSEQVIRDFVNKETWFSGKEAQEYFNIEVTAPIDVVACASEYALENCKNIPDFLNKPQKRGAENHKKNNEIQKCEDKLRLLSLKGAI